AFAALGPKVSDELAGQPLADFQAETLDGQSFALASVRGQPLIVAFFASWCAVCQAENVELRKIHASYAPRGVRMLAVLVDPIETPDPLGEARAALGQAPLPFPVLLMNESHRERFRYVGFPSIYFVASDGRFTTTLYGYQPEEQIAALADRLLGAGEAA